MMSAQPKERTLNILLVEDDEVDVMNVRRAFIKNKIDSSLHVAGNGLDALKILRNEKKESIPENRRLIILDLNMPQMGGIEFLEAMRQDAKLRQVPVIVLTTSNQECDRVNAYRLNVAGYILKPVNFKNFLDIIKTLNAYWKLCEMP